MSSTIPTVYTGFWINWSYGRINGSTITLSPEHGAFLIAFIALFVRFTGGQLWSVLVFLFYGIRSTAEPQDALYHQQQAILRNTSQPAPVLWAMLKLSWFWKGTAPNVYTRTLTFIFTSLAYISAFAVAGIFSSRVTSANSEVLLKPVRVCGNWNYPFRRLYDPTQETLMDFNLRYQEYATNMNSLFQTSHQYLVECYNTSSEQQQDSCLPKGRDHLSWNITTNITCPFDEQMCTAKAVQFDSGFLNSHFHFGINSKDDRIEYRRVLTCAPVRTDGYVSDWVNSSDWNASSSLGSGNPGERFLRFTYGQNTLFDDNTTFAYSNESFTASIGFFNQVKFYDLDVELSPAVPDDLNVLIGSTFTAIQPLSRSDADTVLTFLTSWGVYTTEINDPWFRASDVWNTTITSADGTIDKLPFYTSSGTNVVACAEQHQLRNPLNGATTPLGAGDVATYPKAQQLGYNDNQLAIFNRTFSVGTYISLTNIIYALSGSSLLAATLQRSIISLPLPDNQWQLEFEHWFGIALNATQLWSQQYVSGRMFSEQDRYISPADNDFQKDMCNNQIVLRTDYRSFSVCGLVIIFVFGFLAILANLTIIPIVQLVQARSLKGRYRNAEWQANDILQLQRMAYQHNNIGTWVGQHDMVPRTTSSEVFTLPDSINWQHGIPQSDNENNGLFRFVSHIRSRKTKERGSSVAKSSASDRADQPAAPASQAEKSVHLTEAEVKEKPRRY